MIKTKLKEIQIVNRGVYLYIYLPLIFNDDYLGELDGYVCYTLTFINQFSQELYAADILEDAPYTLSLPQLKDLCDRYSEYVIFSVVEHGTFLSEMDILTTGGTQEFNVGVSLFNTILKDILLTWNEEYEVKNIYEYAKYKESLKDSTVSIFPLKISKQLKMQLLIEKNYTCAYCRKRHDKHELQIHHKKPKSNLGTNRIDNLEVLCENCHKQFHAQSNYNTHTGIIPQLKVNPKLKTTLSNLEISLLFPNLDILIIPKEFRK